jgi:hypothetical protein
MPTVITPSDKISILVYDIDGDYSASQTGGTFGFFWAKDLYTDSYAQSAAGLRSNQTEMFYVDAHFLDAYAFGAYLARNYGGAELIHEIASNHSVDMDSITAALQAQGYSETCTSVFLKEGQALVYTDSDSAENHPSFNKSVTNSVGGYEFIFSPVDLTDYSVTVNNQTVYGPFIFYADERGTMPLDRWGFSVHVLTSNDSIATLNGTASINLAARSANEVLYALIQ